MIVSQFMTTNIFSLAADKTIQDAAELMIGKDISAVPIVDSTSNLVGIITESDFIGKNANIPHALASIKRLLGQLFYHEGVEEIFKKAKTMRLEEVMTRNPKTITPYQSLNDVVDMMSKYNLKRVPVAEGTKLVGMVTRHDILKAFMMIPKN